MAVSAKGTIRAIVSSARAGTRWLDATLLQARRPAPRAGRGDASLPRPCGFLCLVQPAARRRADSVWSRADSFGYFILDIPAIGECKSRQARFLNKRRSHMANCKARVGTRLEHVGSRQLRRKQSPKAARIEAGLRRPCDSRVRAQAVPPPLPRTKR